MPVRALNDRTVNALVVPGSSPILGKKNVTEKCVSTSPKYNFFQGNNSKNLRTDHNSKEVIKS